MKHPQQQFRTRRILLGCLSVAAALIGSAIPAHAQVPLFTNVWNVTAGAFYNLPGANVSTVRGMAINPVTGNILYPTTSVSNHVGVISGSNGSNYLGSLTGTNVAAGSNVITGGAVALTHLKVADDGNVYACNVSLNPTQVFKLYRWSSDSDSATPPEVVYNSGVGTAFQWRVGDYMDVRGSGTNTEIVVVGNGSGANVTTNFVIFRPTDATLNTFTNFSITIPGGVNRCGAGVTFEGTNNALYVRAAGATTVFRVTYNPDTLTATIPSTFTMDYNNNNGLDYFETNGLKLIATSAVLSGNVLPQTNTTVFRAKVMQLITASNAAVVLNQALPQPYQTNGNAFGLVDFKNGVAVFSQPNNGISLYQINGFLTNTPPSLSGGITGGGVYVGGYPINLTISANGASPLSYQWYFNTNTAIPGATSNSWSLGLADSLDEGVYSVIVTNPYGSVTSSFSSVTVLAAGHSTVATQVWTLAPGSRDYLTTGDTQRGLGFDPINNKLVLVSRSVTNGLHVINASTGADDGELDVSLLSAGTPPGNFAINNVAIADDGAVYVANLILSGASDTFAIYRWSDTLPGTPMGLAYFANPGIGRLGDTFAARGAGVNTELIAGVGSGTNIALFTTGDGSSFSFTQIAVTNVPAGDQAGGFARLGLAFGPTNTFWAKSSGFSLRLVRYDAVAGTGEIIATYTTLPGSVAPIGVDNQNNFLAGIGVTQIPQNLAFYDLQAAGGPSLIDREYFASNNANGNGTGTVIFDVAGGRVFSLSSNNGLLAMNYAPRVYLTPDVSGKIVTWSGPGFLQASANVTGTYTNVTGATSPYTNNAPGSLFFRVTR